MQNLGNSSASRERTFDDEQETASRLIPQIAAKRRKARYARKTNKFVCANGAG